MEAGPEQIPAKQECWDDIRTLAYEALLAAGTSNHDVVPGTVIESWLGNPEDRPQSKVLDQQ